MIPNSIEMPAEHSIVADSLELFKTGTRNVLWLTVREGRRFVLKGLPEELRLHPEETARLRKEYSLGLRINHPGVAGVYGFEVHPSVGPVIVMEYVEGVTLETYLKKEKRPPLKIRVAIARQIADSLQYMHSLGLSHRDLKPDNILVTRRDEAKIIDIGLGDSEDSVIYKQSLATESFGAPEQQTPCVGDSRADVYSFGKLLEMLLPESRFRKLRARCADENPEKRIMMAEAAQWLAGNEKNDGSPKTIILVCALVAVFMAAGVVGLRNLYLQHSTPNETAESAVADADNKNTVDNSGELIIEDSREENSIVKKNESETTRKVEEKVLDNENTFEETKYEKIFDRYMTELYGEFNRLGCGFDSEKGLYIDSIANARAIIAPDIMNRMINELEMSGCPYDEMTRFGNLMLENMKKAIERIDGRKLE